MGAERSGSGRGSANTWLLVLAAVLIGGTLGFAALMAVAPHVRKAPPPPPPRVAPPVPATPAARAEVLALTGLTLLLQEHAAGMTGRVTIHVRVEDGGQAGVEADAPVPAASVIKLPLMAAVYDAWKSGSLKRLAVDEARVRRMITVSDNPAADSLLDRVGISQVNTWLEQQRYDGSEVRHKLIPGRGAPAPKGPNVVSAADMTRMLMAISGGELIDGSASSEMRRLLLDQQRRTRIPAGLPEGVVAGNKTGTLRGIVNDVAFVEPPSGPRYAMAVLVSGAGSDAATSRSIAALSRRVYEFLTGAPASP